MDDAFLNWPGWRWVSPIFAMVIGAYFGWDARRTKARGDDFIRDLKHGPAIALVQHLASLKDPHDCPSIDDEIEAWAHAIDTAKSIYGDLSEEEEAHPDE